MTQLLVRLLPAAWLTALSPRWAVRALLVSDARHFCRHLRLDTTWQQLAAAPRGPNSAAVGVGGDGDAWALALRALVLYAGPVDLDGVVPAHRAKLARPAMADMARAAGDAQASLLVALDERPVALRLVARLEQGARVRLEIESPSVMATGDDETLKTRRFSGSARRQPSRPP
jgi:hypothetical protein